MEQLSDQAYIPLKLDVQPAEIIQGPPEAYKNCSKPRGSVFIANWNKFDHVDDKERTGSACDVVNLKNLCKQAGYVIVKSVSDRTEPELFDELKKFREEAVHENVDSCIFVFMSHGSTSYSFRTREGKAVDVEDIYKEFYNEKCIALAGKPKIFIFQFCRGEEGISAITDPDLHTDGGNFTAIQEQRGIADSIVIFSTRPRFVSYREPTKGGVFIQHFCLEFAQKAKNKEIYKLIQEVNRCLSKTVYNQKCDFQVIDGRFDFYFNPTGQETDTKSSISKGTSNQLLPTDEGAMSLDQSKDPQLSMSSNQKQSTASDTQLSSSSQTSREDSTYRSSSEDEIYGSGDDTRSTVFIINYLEGCKEDVKRLAMTFENLEYEVHILPPVENCHSLTESIEEYRMSDGGSVVVFFYGYGYRDEIYVGTSDKESVSMKKFCDLFNQKRNQSNALVVFTNICFRAKSQHTRTYSILREPLEDAFLICVRVNGTCSRGSLLTRAILEEFKENGTSEEFYKFSRNVFGRIRDWEDEGEDLYLKDIRCYGVEKSFYFRIPQQIIVFQTEGCQEKKVHSKKLRGMESQDPSSTRTKTTIRSETATVQGDVKVCDNNLAEYISLLQKLDPGSEIPREANVAVDIRQNVQGGIELLCLLKKHQLRVKDIHIEAYPKDIECPFEFAQAINFLFRRNNILNYFGPLFKEIQLPAKLEHLGIFVDELQSLEQTFLGHIEYLFKPNYFAIIVSAKTEVVKDETPSAKEDILQMERPSSSHCKIVTRSYTIPRSYLSFEPAIPRSLTVVSTPSQVSARFLLTDLYICDVSAVASKWVFSIKELQFWSPFMSFNTVYMHNARLDTDAIFHLLRSLRGVRMRALVLPTICQPDTNTLRRKLVRTARQKNDCLLLWKEITIGPPKVPLDEPMSGEKAFEKWE